MSNLIINVKLLAGTHIRQAIAEAKDLAERMDLAYVVFDFNSVKMSVSRRADVNELAEEYKYALHRECKHVVG